MAAVCRNCGYELKPHWIKCPKCKTPVEEEALVCRHCGEKLEEWMDECPACGKPVSEVCEEPVSKAAGGEAEGYKERARELIANGDYAGALKETAEAIRLNPDDTEAYRIRDRAYAETLANKAESKGASVANINAAWGNVSASGVKKIIFACDAGMGSSAMGATKLRKKIQAAGLTDITVLHSPTNEVPADADIVICHKELRERARNACPRAHLVTITDFLNAPEYEEVIAKLKK